MGGTYNTYGGGEEAYKVFGSENLRERDHLEDLGIDGRLILKWMIKNWNGGMDWSDLVQDRDRWVAFVNAVINFRFP